MRNHHLTTMAAILAVTLTLRAQENDPFAIVRDYAPISNKKTSVNRTSPDLLGNNRLSFGDDQFEPQLENNIDIYDLSFEQLFALKIGIVTKNEQVVFDSPAAVFVLSREDIRRSGATTLPELFRLIPGVEVAKVGSFQRQVSVRGFNGLFSNKLLVLVDGRSIYNNSLATVLWSSQDVVLDNIERIEVIRGPGAAVWGSNAVNGVINIITRSSQDSLGGYAEITGGTEEKASGLLRYSGKLGDRLYYRVYSKYRDRDDARFESGDDANDDWDSRLGGFRIDAEISESDTFTLQGDLLINRNDSTLSVASFDTVPDRKILRIEDQGTTGNIMGTWTHRYSEKSEWTLRSYFDYQGQDRKIEKEPNTVDIVRTFDIDFQHRFSPINHHMITWGLEYRSVDDSIESNEGNTFTPKEETLDYYYLFLQDEIAFWDKRVQVVLGSKLEHNEFTNWEIQPNLRLSLSPSESQIIWGSIARAVRVPNRSEADADTLFGFAFGRSDFPVFIHQNPDPESEELIAYELGYRWKVSPEIFFDLATFYNDYDNLAINNLLFSPPIRDNSGEGEAYGGELVMDWQVLAWWRLISSYAFLEINLNDRPFATNIPLEGSDPEHRVTIRSQMDLFKHVEIDSTLRFVDSVKANNTDSYLELDLSIAWNPTQYFALTVSGLNLLDSEHPEGDNSFFNGIGVVEVQRSFFATLKFGF